MAMKKVEKIVCPQCGMEYLPAEIYLPNYLLGKPTRIVRDENGKILDYDGIDIDTKEKYTCDKCHTTFKVNAKMQFYASFDKVSNFDEEYTMSTHKDVFHLDEEAE